MQDWPYIQNWKTLSWKAAGIWLCVKLLFWTSAMLLILPGKSKEIMNVMWIFSFDADLAGHLLWNRYRQAHHPIRTSNEASGKLHGAEKTTLSWSNSGIRICYMYVYRLDMIDCIISKTIWDIWCISRVFRPARPTKPNKQPAHQIPYNCLKPDLLWFLYSLSLQFPFFVFSLEISFTTKKPTPSPGTSSQLQAGCHRGGSGTNEFLERTSRRRWFGRIDGSTGRVFDYFLLQKGIEGLQ